MPLDRPIDVQALLGLAAGRSGAARAQIANAVTDLFLPAAQRLTDQQRALMTDVLGRLLGTIEMEVRRHLVDALSRSPASQPELEARLASDSIEVARPILERSRVVRNPALMDIVIQCAEEHRMAIALRETVSPPLTEALAERGFKGGEDDVLEGLIRTEDPVLSRRAMELLVAESKRNGQFQQPLLTQNDLPADLAHEVYWWVAAALRRHILKNFVIDQAVLDPMLERAAKRAMVEYDDTQSVQSRALQLARRLNELGELTDGFLLRTLRQGRLSLFTAAFAARAKIAFNTVWRIVTDPASESFIVLAKAVDVSRDATASLVIVLGDLGNAASARPPSAVAEVLRLHDDLDVASARRVLNYWQLDAGLRQAIDDLNEGAA
ncbi:DUF2336 domain-containing protein [Sphingosinicella microcystinivorans]|uniref:Uncharacterized protein (DUF2336 family) n=1 Tax=Sphingosinicella microcystinivorans TaxID=335406 RepID=A0AAD1D7D6_SPHMI|nr:DUF2336 domain-containing protein [Sphingosinicella microcystinivorans]RKS91919.1 uncharacterized protein (DUF2336 family) [Sphingosinicella microcystinivorans]BBE34905.1 hypothetical protein SmB9_25630 [Sphingosinicella microcystinivorans]